MICFESMDGKINRRQAFGVLAGAALSLRLRSAEAETNGPEFLASSLQQKELGEQKVKAVNELINGFWNQPQAREHIRRSFFKGAKDRAEIGRMLQNESRMYIPTPQKSEEVRERTLPQLTELSKAVSEKKYGLFVDGDEQTLYVLQNIGKDKIQFVKAYPVSTSREVWSNGANSRGTPLGLHRVAQGKRGVLGEVVSSPMRGVREFARISMRENRVNRKKTFVRSLASGGDAIAEIVTAAFLLTGPTTRSTRGIYIHGTNRTNQLGQPGSGGCIRMSNVDVYDLSKYLEVGKLQDDEMTAPGGTPVMLHATKNVVEAPKRRTAPETDQDPKTDKTPKVERPPKTGPRFKRDEDVIFYSNENKNSSLPKDSRR